MPVLSLRQQRGNIARLTVAQALAGANSVVVYATGSIVGNILAPDKSLATLPITVFVVGMAACILPMGVIARRYGRRMAFLAGTGCGVLVGLLSALAVVLGSFWLFCLATFFGGAYAAVVLSFRFAAADGVEPKMRARSLSFVMGGGVAAGVIGPQLVTYTMDLWQPFTFAITYIVQAAVAALSAVVLFGVRLPQPSAKKVAGGRPLSFIVRQPRFITAIICAAVSYMLMNFIMTSAPLAMQMCGHTQDAANLGMQWHVIAMYLPSFFYRAFNNALWRRTCGNGRFVNDCHVGNDRFGGHRCCAFLVEPDFTGCWLELWFRGGISHGAGMPPARRSHTGAIV